MATATARKPRQEEVLPEVVGRGIDTHGCELYVVPSASEPTRAHLVRVVGPSGRYRCDCTAGQHGRTCRHVRAVIALELAEMERGIELKRQATAIALAATNARLARVNASIDAAARRETSAPARSNPAPFSIFKV
jgi:hypothetical protein